MNLADLFTVVALTDAINKTPMPPSRIGSSGLFRQKGARTTSVYVEYKAGRLVLVPAMSRNDNPTPMKKGGRNGHTFEVPHLPVSGVIQPNDIQNVRAFGQEADANAEADLQAAAEVINDTLEELKGSLEATREFHRLGAIKGVILDASGSVIYDLYDEFGITKKASNLALGTSTTKTRGFFQKVCRHIEQNSPGMLVTRKRAYCGSDFFDALVDHDTVKEAYAGYQEAQDRIGGDVRSGFTFGGIEWIDYPDAIGETTFIAANKAHVFPVGAGAFTQFNAPANYNEAVNTVGKEFYAKAEERRMGKGWDLEAQSNPLAMCHYPEALYELTAT